MKKFLFLKLLVLVTCLSCALRVSAQIYVDGIYYYQNGNNTLMVTHQLGPTIPINPNYPIYTGAVTIPSTVNIGGTTFTVTEIAPYAFYHCTGLTSVTLPNTITQIDDYAFAYNQTSSPNFNTITIPNSVETIGDYAFYNTAITTLYLGFRVVSIGDYAFSASNSYVSNVYCYAYLPPTIQENTFVNEGGGPYGWHFRGTLHLLAASYNTNRYQSTDYWMRFLYFTTISGSTAYDVQIGGLYYMLAPTLSNNFAWVTNNGNYNCYTSSSYTVPANVTWRGESFRVTGIGNSAFRNCTSVSTLDLRNATNLTYINDYACYGANVSTVYLSPVLTEIGDYAFYNSSVSKLYTNNSTPPTIKSNTFSTRYSTCWVYVPYPRDIATYKAATYWSNFVNYFGAQPYDFYVNGIYYKITGTNTVEVTNKWGGYGMLNNESDYSYSGNVTVPNTVSWNGTTYNVTAIGEYAFFEARNANLNSTGESPSLRYQGDLRSVTIGSNVTTIKDYAFWGCTGLTTVTCNRSTPPTIQSSTFDSDHYSTTKVYVPSTTAVNNYKAANYWKKFYMILPNDGTELDYALNVEGGNIHFTTDSYPWTVAGDGTRVYARSFNIPYAAQSNMYANVNLTKESTLTFDYLAKLVSNMGGIDLCYFYIDDEIKFVAQAVYSNWMSYSVDIPAGTHTLRWMFLNDSYASTITVNYFAVDNVKLTEKAGSTGDVNGDNQVNIADVTALIDSLLSGVEVPTHVADVNGDGLVTIADVTALIDQLLGN